MYLEFHYRRTYQPHAPELYIFRTVYAVEMHREASHHTSGAPMGAEAKTAALQAPWKGRQLLERMIAIQR